MSSKNITHQSIKDKIKSAFNRAEKSYDNNCQIQMTAGNKLTTLVKQHCSCEKKVIDLGCGTGIVTEILADAIASQEFHAIDFAEELLGKAYERLAPLRIKTYSADFDYLPFYKDKFDIIFSNMALHWSTHLTSTLSSINSLLTDDGILAFSIPLPGTFVELEQHFSTNKFISENNLLRRLSTSGFEIILHEHDNIILHFPDTLSTLKSIKLVGANMTSKKPSRRLRGKALLEQTNLTSLTYVIGYFIVRKKSQSCQ